MSPLKKLAVFSSLFFILLAGFTTITMNSDNSPLQKAYNSIPNDSSLKYLYSDIGFAGPEDTSSADCLALNEEFVMRFATYEKKCKAIRYEFTGYMTNAVLIKGANPEKTMSDSLLIYNHGHDGLPSKSEDFGYELILRTLEGGGDVLLVSMPFIGIDKQVGLIKVKTWDGEAEYDFKQLAASPAAWHGVFEMFDTGTSHYMRFFVDSAVLNAINLAPYYKKVNFVGLSGGATTGLYACNILKKILDHCILVAGVMPLKYRFVKENFGDAEQISSSFFKKHSVFNLISEISRSREKLHLIFNDEDTCCFRGETAKLFESDLKSSKVNVSFLIRKSSHHDYDPEQILGIIHSK
ncbi:hypothetical protein GVN18_13795 [Pseudomonas sp. ODNR1LW]|nr:hypothetical protein [Pseudomonas sp. ODNR1LW]